MWVVDGDGVGDPEPVGEGVGVGFGVGVRLGLGEFDGDGEVAGVKVSAGEEDGDADTELAGVAATGVFFGAVVLDGEEVLVADGILKIKAALSFGGFVLGVESKNRPVIAANQEKVIIKTL